MSDEPDGPPPAPWFTVALGFNVSVSVAWTLAVGAVTALVCVGEPDIIDAVIYWIYYAGGAT